MKCAKIYFERFYQINQPIIGTYYYHAQIIQFTYKLRSKIVIDEIL